MNEDQAKLHQFRIEGKINDTIGDSEDSDLNNKELRETLGKIGEALEYFYRIDPLVSMF